MRQAIRKLQAGLALVAFVFSWLGAPSAARGFANDPYYPLQWGLQVMEVPAAWGSVTPDRLSQIIVAVVDTGVDGTHPDLKGNVLDGHYFLTEIGPDRKLVTRQGELKGTENTDDNGHGTHVAGIIAATRNNGEGIAGVAPGVKILPVKVLDSRSQGYVEDAARGIIWATDHGARVINLSLGSPEESKVVRDAVRYALDRGVVVVAASGNDGKPQVYYPAAQPGVVAVSAIEKIGGGFALPSFANYGEELTTVAPGVGIWSTYPRELDNDGDPDGYRSWTGSSSAVPFVSGLAALILARNPSLTVDEVRTIIKYSGESLGGITTEAQRWGLANARRALGLDRLKIELKKRVLAWGDTVEVQIKAIDPLGYLDYTVQDEVPVVLRDYDNEVLATKNVKLVNGAGSVALTFPTAGRKQIQVGSNELGGRYVPGFLTVWVSPQIFIDPKLIKGFIDTTDHWARDDIALLAKQGIVEGVDAQHFEPERPVTRAEFAVLLVRGLGLSETAEPADFEDVRADAWYAGAVNAAADAGLILGYQNRFRPDDRITREEMTVMLVRAYHLATNIDISWNTGQVEPQLTREPLVDANRISPWARPAVLGAYVQGLVFGRPDGTFDPRARATRAEAAVMLGRLLRSLS